MTVTGWGAITDSERQPQAILKQTNIQVFSQKHCNGTHEAMSQDILKSKVQRALPNLFQSNVLCAGK